MSEDMDTGSTEAEDEQEVEQDLSSEDEQLGPRVKKVPGHFKDFVLRSGAEEEQELQNLAFYSTYEDPETYDEACKSQVWKDAMDVEIKAIEANNTWELWSKGHWSKMGLQNQINNFKQSMMKKFSMSDLGKMKYFLGVEVSQTDEGIHQMKYATEILAKFGMENCNSVSSPIVTGCRLVKNEGGKAIDAKSYKQMIHGKTN
ncbi:copia-type polyprotein [Trifolium medium]|uniref:Copia-type polyprotein n=1 Tax=Trifolium medium TaxID=97028 RepID=A0A392N307_9FABA|nr:copia-type polyprotein [Trifolium medium]